jgi:hypothetical protein
MAFAANRILIAACCLCILSLVNSQAIAVPTTGLTTQPTSRPAEAGAFDSLAAMPWPATDALGRELPVAGEVPAPRTDRFVGIFYFLWHDQTRRQHSDHPGPDDLMQILHADPKVLQHPASPLWSKIDNYAYWGEPLYGYYQSADPWVLRRHNRLLVDAGIDTLIFDTTNAKTYPAVCTALCDVLSEIRSTGGRTPRIAFMVNTKAGETADTLYHQIYEKGRYKNLWFIWQGKPLLLCDESAASPTVKKFFTLRAAHWPTDMQNPHLGWHWESTYPQPYGFTDDPSRPEQVNVAVAQNLAINGGGPVCMSSGNARGRSFHDGHEDTRPGAVNQGWNFGEQWGQALKLDPPFVMVTGWNEWIAGRFPTGNGSLEFVDQFTEEYSRDIEPMRGGHGDNYYYQLVANVRRYKGVAPIPLASAPKTIDISSKNFDAWQEVSPEFADTAGDVRPRQFAGIAGLKYSDNTGRNLIVASKVSRDRNSIYFYTITASAITPRTDSHWMWLFIRTPAARPDHAWEGYDFIVNRTINPDGTTWLERSTGGWNWQKVAVVPMTVVGNQLQLAIPRGALDLGNDPITVDFKWADNLQHPGDPMDFYTSGNVSPAGRFRFRYLVR